MMRKALCVCFLIPILLFSGLASISAQAILVQVTEAETGQPISGAFLSLSREDGTVLRRALTNAEGRFLLQPGAPGSFTVRGEMIGRESLEESGIILEPGETKNLLLQLSVNPISLAGIQVEAEEKCRLLPEEASAISVVWEEARKALVVQDWAEREESFSFQVVEYERDMDADGRRVEKETRHVNTGVSNNPIRSLPAKELMEKGFIQPLDRGGWDFWGPDAAVLLSNDFLDAHCFHLRSDNENPGVLGLAFEPNQATERTDIQGTLWLDRATASLQFLEYGYTWAEYPEARGVAGGRVEFEELPNGAWIVRRWWIRMPHLVRDRARVQEGRSGIFVSGIRESGAHVTQISTQEWERVDQMEAGSLEGVVWDSTSSRPLEGVEVYLSGTAYSSVTDAEGQFLMENIPQGIFLAAFDHPRLDELGVSAGGVEVEISPDGTSDVRLGVPSLDSFILETCSRDEQERGPGFLTGVVRDRSSGEVIPESTVSFSWQEYVDWDLSESRRVEDKWFEAQTDGKGRYSACGLPTGTLINVQASYMDLATTAVPVRISEDPRVGFLAFHTVAIPIPWVPEDPYPVLDLEVDLSVERADVTLSDLEALIGLAPTAAPSSVGDAGSARIRGVVKDLESEDPLEGALVSVEGVRANQITDAEGRFELTDIPPGARNLDVSLIGYSSRSDPIEVPPASILTLEVGLTVDPIGLDPITVSVERRNLNLELSGFYERRDATSGRFITRDRIEERAPLFTTDLFQGMAGVKVVGGLGMGTQKAVVLAGSRALSFSGGGGACYPAVWIDGQMVHEGSAGPMGAGPAFLDELIQPEQIAGVEVYKSAASLPVQYNLYAACGVIVIWTR